MLYQGSCCFVWLSPLLGPSLEFRQNFEMPVLSVPIKDGICRLRSKQAPLFSDPSCENLIQNQKLSKFGIWEFSNTRSFPCNIWQLQYILYINMRVGMHHLKNAQIPSKPQQNPSRIHCVVLGSDEATSVTCLKDVSKSTSYRVCHG